MKTLIVEEIIHAIGGRLMGGNPKRTVTGVSIDSRTVREGDLFIPIIGERVDGHQFITEALQRGCSAFLAMPSHFDVMGEPLCKSGEAVGIECLDTIQALQDLARWYIQEIPMKKIAITGSTGKTTTKEMVYHICSEKYSTQRNIGNFNNHIGLPLTILSFEEGTQVGALEMGMSEKGEINLLADIVRPQVAIITNIGTAHIENLGTREDILGAKLEIANYLQKEDLLILNRDSDLLSQVKIPCGRILSVGEKGKNDLIISSIEDLGENGIRFTLEHRAVDTFQSQEFRLHIPGRHNAYNAALAVAAGLELGISMKEAAVGLDKMRETDKRLSVKGKNGIKIIDDTYNASVDSMKSALDLLETMVGVRKVAVLGDMLEMGEKSSEFHGQIGAYLKDKGVDLLITVGKASKDIARGAPQTSPPIKKVHYNNKEELILELKKWIEPGDVVLFKGSRGIGLDAAVRHLLED